MGIADASRAGRSKAISADGLGNIGGWNLVGRRSTAPIHEWNQPLRSVSRSPGQFCTEAVWPRDGIGFAHLHAHEMTCPSARIARMVFLG